MNKAIFDIETSGLSCFEDEIIAIGIRVNKRSYIFSRKHSSERELLLQFLGKLKNENISTLVGFNCFNFDIPFIKTKLMKYVENIPTDMLEGLGYIDLRYAVSPSYMAKGKLSEYGEMFCIENSTKSQGADMPILYADKNFDIIEQHLRDDLLETAELYNRLVAIKAKLKRIEW
jgi:uncharacterized protein YprB with RNaseH-like and TPR domain